MKKNWNTLCALFQQPDGGVHDVHLADNQDLCTVAMRNAGNMFAEGTLPEFSDMEDKTAAGLIDDNNMDVIK